MLTTGLNTAVFSANYTETPFMMKLYVFVGSGAWMCTVKKTLAKCAINTVVAVPAEVFLFPSYGQRRLAHLFYCLIVAI